MSSVDKIRELLELMTEHDLVELQLEEEAFKVRLKKPGAVQPTVTGVPAPLPMPLSAPAAGGAPAATDTAANPEDAGLKPIKSPIVGTFYRAPSPEAEPFASEGDTVSADSVVCIIEAMKIMNEIKAEVAGTIEKIVVENGDPVEYGQTLFLVRP